MNEGALHIDESVTFETKAHGIHFHADDVLAVQCPFCGAPPMELCTSADHAPLVHSQYPHTARVLAAEGETPRSTTLDWKELCRVSEFLVDFDGNTTHASCSSHVAALIEELKRARAAVNIVEFLDDILSGSGAMVTLAKTQEHDGVRMERRGHDEPDVIWINDAIGDADESDYLAGETFSEAMADLLRQQEPKPS